ncbi:MAG: hypothetical protein NTV26_02165 [Caldiserica bacterium]|nr:hypothetical protein [Caldisericota bacterium]
MLSWPHASRTIDGLSKQYAALLRQQPLDLAGIRNVMFGEVDIYVALLGQGIENDMGSAGE